jgi:drug/metabolite transporter (DMT)-like permease
MPDSRRKINMIMIKKITETKWTGVVLAIIGILLIVFGIYRGEMSVVFTKAINICMECIGIG